MADRKLEYWYDWEIAETEGSSIKKIGPPPPIINKNRLNNISYLCKIIEENFERALMNPSVCYRIVMLRQKALKNEKDSRRYDRVCKAIRGDRRRRKKEATLKELKIMIQNDINFFKIVRKKIKKEGIRVVEAISDYLIKDAKSTRAVDRRFRELSSYRQTYYAYEKKIDELNSAGLTEIEIFAFFEKAGKHIHAVNALVEVTPETTLVQNRFSKE